MTTKESNRSDRDREDRGADGPSARPAGREPEGRKPDQLDPHEEKAKDRQEALIDESVEESFPASDPPTPKRIT